MIALVDYGAGNLASVRKALTALGADVATPAAPTDLDRARGIIVPGVGHFGATRRLDAEWRVAIRRARDRGAALLGVCLGMQWLFEGSDEAPDVPGLGILSGVCRRLVAGDLKVPHVGWNSLEPSRPSALMRDVPAGAQVYFTHSYVAPVTRDTVAVTTYRVPFAAAVESERVWGVQFHPEKSAEVGLRILRSWLALSDAGHGRVEGLDAV